MSQQKEYRLSVDWVDDASRWLFKILWFVVVVTLLIGLGDYLASLLFPRTVYLGFIRPGSILPFLYIMWRFQGGKVHLQNGEIVISWGGRSENQRRDEDG